MLTQLDFELFPDECLVYDTGDSFLYPIFKNGSSSLMLEQKLKNWKILSNAEISCLQEVNVLIRSPKSRLDSGIQTYINNLLRNNEELDKGTIEFFIDKYGALNQHYMPQFHWLLHLSRFTNTATKMNLIPFSDISMWTANHSNVSDRGNNQNELLLDDVFQLIDNILYDNLLNRSVTFTEVMQYLRDNCTNEYNEILEIRNRIQPLYAV
jgi:hypothetical protein